MDGTLEQEDIKLDAAIHDIRTHLLPENYGWQKALLAHGLFDAAVHADFWQTHSWLGLGLNTKLPDGKHAFVCDTGSILALDILKKYGIEGKLVRLDEPNIGYEFTWDGMVLLPKNKVIRVAPMFPLVDTVSPQWSLQDLTKTEEEIGHVRRGIADPRIDQQEAFLLAFLRRGAWNIHTSIGYIRATDEIITLTYSATKNDGKGRKEDMDILFTVPRSRDILKSKPTIDSLMKWGMAVEQSRLIRYEYDAHEKRKIEEQNFENTGWLSRRNFIYPTLPQFWKDILETGLPAVGVFIHDLVRLSDDQAARILWDGT